MSKKAATKLLLDKTYFRIWHRGENYADQNKVDLKKSNDREVEAKVQGTKEYNVKLKFIKNGIRRDCDCPYPKSVCKHIVAVAILWDEKRGFKRPSVEQVDSLSRGLSQSHRKQLEAIFEDPLNANLNVVRKVPEWAGWTSARKSAHAKLPTCPTIDKHEKQPLQKEEVMKALQEMESWSERSSYDFYFCSGEMTAGFCELLKVIEKRLSASKPQQVIMIMALCVDWFYREFNQRTDGSDGVWIFPAAKIGNIVAKLLEKYPQNRAWEKFRSKVREVGEWWGEPDLNEKVVASWKEETL